MRKQNANRINEEQYGVSMSAGEWKEAEYRAGYCHNCNARVREMGDACTQEEEMTLPASDEAAEPDRVNSLADEGAIIIRPLGRLLHAEPARLQRCMREYQQRNAAYTEYMSSFVA